MQIQPKPLYLSQIITLLFSGIAYAQNTPADVSAASAELETIYIQGERSAPNVSVITDRELRQTGAQNIDDTVLYTPGVDVKTDPMQAGHFGYTIRGMSNDHVVMTIDGIELPNSVRDFRGPGSIGREEREVNRDTVETDTLRRISIDKSGGSGQGASSVGGSVNMATYNPEDLVSAENPTFFGLRYGYRSTYRSHGATATLAGTYGGASGLLIFTRRYNHEIENYSEKDDYGANRLMSNQQNSHQYNILAKGNIRSGSHKIETTFEQFSRETDTLRQDRMRRNGRESTTYNEYLRRRISAAYRYLPTNSWLDEANIRVYRQTMESVDNTDHFGASTQILRRDFHQSFNGIQAKLRGHAQTGGMMQRFSAAAGFNSNKTGRLLDETTTPPAPRPPNHAVNRLFPKTKRDTYFLDAQNSTVFGNGAVLSLGLRYEHEKTRFDVDEAYLARVFGKPAVSDTSQGHLLPSVKFTMPFTGNLTGFASYRRGFRSAAAELAGIGFDGGRYYRVRPNPNLKSETSDNFETGLRYNSPSVNLNLAAFYSRYKNFINIGQTTLNPPIGGYSIEVMPVNNGRVTTYGIELGTEWHLTSSWKLRGALSWMRGTVKEPVEQPLSTANPLTGVLGVEYGADKWGIATNFRWAARQKRVANGNFQTPGYGVWDMTAYFRPWRNLEVNAGVYNIGNRRYWRHADVAGLSDNNLIERYTQPGRNFSLGASLKF